MDIWQWVDKLYSELKDSGQERIAELLYDIPHYVCEYESSKAEALLPEALTAAKAMKNTWMEVFLRHWRMRLLLGTYNQGEVALAEAVSLLEFAHRPENIDCPQSVCVTQDISSCYANIDAPGWADERKAVCKETLARITPSWSCFRCISLEYIYTLISEKKYEDAFELLENNYGQIKAAGLELDRSYYHTKAEILYFLGRNKEALEILEKVKSMEFDTDDKRSFIDERLIFSKVYAALGRSDDAYDIIPGWKEIVPGNFKAWMEACYAIAQEKPEFNTWGLGSCCQEALEYSHRVGAHRDVINLGAILIRLALKRGARHAAGNALTLMRDHLPQLRKVCGADILLKELEHEFAGALSPALPVPVSELLEYLDTQENPDPEHDLELLYVALEEAPDNSEIVLKMQEALEACSNYREAKNLLRNFIKTYPEQAQDILPALIPLLDRDGGEEELSEMAAFIAPHDQGLSYWCQAHLAYRQSDYETAGKHLEKLLEERPEAIGVRRFWAHICMLSKDYTKAAELYTELVGLLEEDEKEFSNELWDLITAASANADWRLVRQTANRLGFEVEESDEPIDERGEWIRLVYHENGEEVEHTAVRTGPVTARVLSVARPGQIQRVGDWVVFDASPLEQAPEDEEEKKTFSIPFRAVHTLERANHKAWAVETVEPENDIWFEFRDKMYEQGLFVWNWGWGYELVNPEDPDGEGLPGFYFGVSAPADYSPARMIATLTELTREWEHPVAWHDLAEEAGEDVEKHREIIKKYGM